MRLASILRKASYEVDLIDCLYSFSKKKASKNLRQYGCQHFSREIIKKPEVLEFVPRNFKSYGVSHDHFKNSLTKLNPNLIVVSCIMSYWYTGAQKVIQTCKNIFPEIPIWLGGLYPFLWPEHAMTNSRSEMTFSTTNYKTFLDELNNYFDNDVNNFTHGHISPSYDLLNDKRVIPLLTSLGCQYRCDYCASSKIYPDQIEFPVQNIIKDIKNAIMKFDSTDFVFYDDALLSSRTNRFISLCEKIISEKLDIRFHTPNALHAKFIDYDLAKLMKKCGFKTIRLGLEFFNETKMKATGGKVTEKDFIRAIDALKRAGFKKEEIGTYVLYGYPDVKILGIKEACDFVFKNGSLVKLSMYSPIPGTKSWGKGFEDYIFNPADDPLLTNPSLAPYRSKSIKYEDYVKLKDYIINCNCVS